MDDTIIAKDVEDANVIILGVNYDGTSSYGKGSDQAPNAIIEVLDKQIEIYERLTGLSPSQDLKINYKDLGDFNKLSSDKMVSKIKNVFKGLYSKNKFIITLGGEHSVTNGPLEAINELNKSSDITVVQIDAHFDLRPDDSDYNAKPLGKYVHSAVMRRAFESGFKIIPIGVRAYHGELELGFAKKNKIKFFEWGKDSDPKISEIIKAIPTKDVYLTIDVDGFDPAVMPSTGTPVPDGLQWRYGMNLLKEIFNSKNVLAADIVEVIPERSTIYNAAQLLYYLIALKQKDIITRK